jgi:starch-binding outer membrane protein, SusD/RagB family
MTIINKFLTLTGLVAIAISSCKKNYIDPTRVPVDNTFTTPQSMISVANGLQRVYTAGRGSSAYNFFSINGLMSNEHRVVNTGNVAEAQLGTGGAAVDGTHTMVAQFWATSNKIVFDADQVLNAAQGLGDKNLASGIIGYTTIFKALAIGNMAQFWTNVPDGTGTNVNFISRTAGYQRAITSINSALAQIASFPIQASFANNIPPGIDIVNTLNALKARYSMAIGNTVDALAAANIVDLTKRSTFNYDALVFNSVFEVSTSTNNVVQPINATLGLPASLAPAAADARVPFYINTNAPATVAAPRFLGFFTSTTATMPIYLPGEMTLIKAEAYARQTTPDLANAQVELNKILVKTAATDPFGVGANLPAYSGAATATAILEEIYKQRCIELYSSGLKVEDMRRFGRPMGEFKRSFLPYPFRERDNNPNTPMDPPF